MNKLKITPVTFAALIALSACSGNSGFQSSESKPIVKNIDVEFQANPETSVKTRGGYKVYVGTSLGFALDASLRTVDIAGNTEQDGKVRVTLSEIPAGKYYLKVLAYSDLNDPNTGTSAKSLPSEEVSFNVQ
ncbi:hypothetical protein [Bdellovibrio sp.]|uniref:hypothetical protein n=1 Tax=Bdellovibrio sp. TaxID=28201 RepID=UPI0039E4033C